MDNSMKILIVEDELIAAENLSETLQDLGYAVAGIVDSGEEAITATAALKPDLVLMDIMLQGQIDGVTAAATLRYLNIPVIFMTAYGDRDTIGRAKVTEPLGYLVKPFKPQDLQATVEIAWQKHLGEMQQREELQKQQDANQLKSRFISQTSHELRTPLTAILSSSELLKHYSDKLSEEKKQKSYQRIESAVQAMTETIDELLLVSQADSGQLHFNPQPLDLTQFCLELVDQLRVGDRHKHTLNFQVMGTPAHTYLDQKLLGHILQNLLSNALKYSPEGTTVDFLLTYSASAIVLMVQDRGIGIPPNDLKQLFQPFYRATNTGKIKGTGLGLNIVKYCVELHGGKISVDSTEGVGTTFTVRLPVAGL
ncbi:MAG TPA: response regulator [Oscillatoriaceae cyanobacterium M33_DOE_052]|uniref:histidine kinase n=1 Tax=Planktothricoides sp. SpSt-374 TaxID=2282167 RepID=A0A7C3ZIL7_9CYAN|nr:response regulator [Oscillatoriaceae cyanobacterium M33_DOE_052]